MKKILSLCLAGILLSACASPQQNNETSYPLLPQQEPNKERILTDTVKVQKKEFFAQVDGKYGLIDHEGSVLIPMQYQKLYYTNSKEYLGKTETGYELLQNYQVVPEFQEVMNQLETQYDSYVFEPQLGLWRVRKDDKRTYMKMDGTQLTEKLFEYVSPVVLPSDGDGHPYVASNLFASHRKRNGKFYCMIHNSEGKPIISAELLSWNHDETLTCSVMAMAEFTDPNTYQSAYVSYVIVEENGTLSAYDNQGEVLFKDATNYQMIDGTYLEYKGKENSYLIDLQTGQRQIKDYEVVNGDYHLEKKNGLYGITRNDNTIIPFLYESVQPKTYAYDWTDYIIATKQGKQEIYDWEGIALFSYDPDLVKIRNTRDKSFWIATDKSDKVQLWDRQGKPLVEGWFDQIDVGYHFIMTKRDQAFAIYDKSMKLLEEGTGYADVMLQEQNPFYMVQSQENMVAKDTNGITFGEILAHDQNIMIVKQNEELHAFVSTMQLPLGKYSDETKNPEIQLASNGRFISYNRNFYHVDFGQNSYFKVAADQIEWAGYLELERSGMTYFYKVVKNGKMALMTETGELITGFDYDDFGTVSSYGFVAAKQQDTWSVLNFKGEKVVDEIELKQVQGPYDYEYVRIREWYLTQATDKSPYELGSMIYTK